MALNGCCLTATEVAASEVSFDLVPETLSRTAFEHSKVGDLFNAERSLRFGDEVGGHLVSGHIDGVVFVSGVESFEVSKVVTFQVPPHLMKFILEKGYIGLNGASLTVAHVDKAASAFKVALIPETLERTTFGGVKVGDRVNLEIDRTTQAVVTTVERMREEVAGA